MYLNKHETHLVKTYLHINHIRTTEGHADLDQAVHFEV